MAADVCEPVFNEKELYTGDVVGEDDDFEPPSPLPSQSALPGLGAAASSSGGRLGRALARSATAGKAAGTGAKGGAAAAERRRRRAAERATKIVYWLETKYDILHEVCTTWDHWKESPSATYDFDILWCDTAIPADRFMKLKQYQKMNHFVGMSSITRKNNLGRNLLRMRKQFPKEYKFFPDTWILPTDLSDFKQQFSSGKSKTFIVKPDNGCQGKGIFLIRDVEKVPVDFSQTYVAQRYITKPFLLDGFKFDLRLYVLVVGCDPLRIFLHRRGLVRLASEEYAEPSGKNISQTMVHLTNYAVNKMNPNFEENTDPDDAQDGHKRSWEAVFQHLREEGHDVDKLMTEIEDLIVKTLIAVQPSLSHFYHSCQPDDCENGMCFEVLGFDIMLDQRLQPWLLEVNHAPSFGAESELDRVVKFDVLRDTLQLLNLTPEARRQKKREAREKMEQRAMGALKKQSLEDRMVQEKVVAHERTRWEDDLLLKGSGYKRLYPSREQEQEYMHILDAAVNIWEMLMGGNSRRPVLLGGDKEDETKPDERPGRKGAGDAKRQSVPEAKDGEVKERVRTKEELQEVVDRLTAGCSARPRGGQRPPRGSFRGTKEVQPAGPVASPATTAASLLASADGAQNSVLDDVVQEVLKPEQHPASDSRGSASSQRLRRFDVQVGDMIKVQTNLGWEHVTVTAKRVNGKLDIEFKDGEHMRSVLPRILKEDPEPKSSVADSPASRAASRLPSPPATSSSAASTGRTAPPDRSPVRGGVAPAAAAAAAALEAPGSRSPGGPERAPERLPSKSLQEKADGLPAGLAGGSAGHFGGSGKTGGSSPRTPRGDTPACPEDALQTLDHQVSSHLRARVQKRNTFGAGASAVAATDQQQQPTGGHLGGAGSRNPRGATGAAAGGGPPPFQLQQLISVRPIATGASSRPGALAHDPSDRAAPSGWTPLVVPPGPVQRTSTAVAGSSYARAPVLPGRSTFTGGK